ncbi:hypothetical protein E0H77_08915 [Acinetobacter sp. ANC 4633]|uniref:hypothetical protein n=1 Tax=Acinetobacter sp. ANC 4633 TaxID=2529845 RepID=UPI00103FD98B|nr:hypothetical protein [Acinetobacter sp. ANC 4633]TCB25193.1 hypothetical protein E0H77_08915 [Acinetobacter sp. ANC 4633]
MMQCFSRILLPAFMLAGSLSLAACQKQPEHISSATTASSAAMHTASEVSIPQNIRPFTTTPDDAHDIQQLDTFNRTFHDMTQDMRTELEQLKQYNQLTPEFVEQRKQDQIHSALNMLKDLDLKTEQGRYIQGMMYDYWDQLQHKKVAEKVDKTPVIQAIQQLEYWKAHTANTNPAS